MKAELISVIVPVYNVEEFLPRCIESLLSQTYQPIEIILVDDGSTDGSGSICDEYAVNHSCIHVIHTENHGLSAARNRGLQEAGGIYIGFVDSDDWIEPEMYAVLLQVMVDSAADISCIRPKMCRDDNPGAPRKSGLIDEITEKVLFNAIIEDENIYGYVWNKLFKRALIQEKNLQFNEKLLFCEDLEFTTKYLTVCTKGVYCDSKLYHYRQHSTSITNKVGFSKRRLSILTAYELITPIFEEYCPEYLPLLYWNYWRENLYILETIYCENYCNKAIRKVLVKNLEVHIRRLKMARIIQNAFN